MAERYAPLNDPNFDVDPLTKTRQQMIIDDEGNVRFVNVQNVDDILLSAHESRANFTKSQKLGDIAPVGRIPMLVMYDLIQRGIWKDPERRRRWWDSIEAAPYRLREFRV